MRLTVSRRMLVRALVVVAVGSAALFAAFRASSGAPEPPAVSTAVTSWRLPRLGTGGEVSLAALRGRPVVVDFFASWCTACRGELPEMATVSREVAGRVTFVGVDSQENGDGLAMAHQSGVDWWLLASDSGGPEASGLHDALGARGMPVTAFYSSDGKLLRVLPGALSGDDLRGLLRSLYGTSA